MGKAAGKAKEAYGAMIGDEAKQAEKERGRQRRKDDGGLGGLADNLPGL